MIETLLICTIIFMAFGLFSFLSDFLTKPKVEIRQRTLEPFCSRHLKEDEIGIIIHELVTLDAIHPISPANYHDDTQLFVEQRVRERTGRYFQLDPKDWFNICRAWYVTRGQETSERIERLDLRLKLNI